MIRRIVLTLIALCAVARVGEAATITVTSTADVINPSDGFCTLREAINAVNSNKKAAGAIDGECPAGDDAGGADVVKLPAGVYLLTNGPMHIVSAITMQGDGKGISIIDGGGTDRILFTDTGTPAALTLKAMTLRNGLASGNGGAIVHNEGSLTIEGCAFEGNVAIGNGGALMLGNGGATTIRQSEFTSNKTQKVGTNPLRAGAICSFSTAPLLIEESVFQTNETAGSTVAAAIDVDISTGTGDLTIHNSTFRQNKGGSGAMTINLQNTKATISGSTFSENQNIGGVYLDKGTLSISGTTLTKNQGPGLQVGTGGGDMTLTQSAIDHNEGGILLLGGATHITLSTFFNNNLNIHNAGFTGSAIFVDQGAAATIDLHHVTIAGHTVRSITMTEPVNGAASTTLENVLIAQNGSNCPTGNITSFGHNLIGDAVCPSFAGLGDLVGMQFNSAITTADFLSSATAGASYIPLLGTSAAINPAHPAACTDASAVDQLGHVRDSVCDIGAIEAYCGDGIAQSTNGEQCDTGAKNSDTGACTSTCQLAVCGDGKVQAGVETCDDGNQINDDGCPNTCQSPKCGDQITQINLGEACDDGNQSNTDGCLNSCAAATCGDGFVHDGTEACDDSNTVGGDGCSADCKKIEKCGDGVVDSGEKCDDGNAVDTDTCSNACKIVAAVTPAVPQAPPVDNTTPATNSTTSSGGCSLIIPR